MRKILALALFFCTVSLSAPEIAHADMFGGDIVILTQILTQTISELAELKQIFQNGNDTLGLLKDVNRESMTR